MSLIESITTAVALTAGTGEMLDITNTHYKLTSTSEILVTSEKGDRLASKENVDFTFGQADGVVIKVQPDFIKQTLHGIGTAIYPVHLHSYSRISVKRNESR